MEEWEGSQMHEETARPRPHSERGPKKEPLSLKKAELPPTSTQCGVENGKECSAAAVAVTIYLSEGNLSLRGGANERLVTAIPEGQGQVRYHREFRQCCGAGVGGIQFVLCPTLRRMSVPNLPR